MRKLTSPGIRNLHQFIRYTIAIAVREPIKNGLNEMFKDAEEQIGDCLKKKHRHGYSKQVQGEESKLRDFCSGLSEKMIRSVSYLYQAAIEFFDSKIRVTSLKSITLVDNVPEAIIHDELFLIVNLTKLDSHALTNKPLYKTNKGDFIQYKPSAIQLLFPPSEKYKII